MGGDLKERLKAHLARHHPKFLATYQYYFTSRSASWGGPFNGQVGRSKIFQELIANIRFNAIIETGTFRGTTTEFLATESKLPVYTVEAEPLYHHFSKLRFRRFPSVSLERLDSRIFLETLSRNPAVPKENVFFYLDAHWKDDLPLREEIVLIDKSWRGVVIMVDDFQVPGDPGYGYDDYGPDKSLTLEYLAPLVSLGFQTFFPTLLSAEETGRKRGCVVLADSQLADRVKKIKALKWRQA